VKKVYKCPNCKSEKLICRDLLEGQSFEDKCYWKPKRLDMIADDAQAGLRVDVCADCGTVYCWEAKL
jgi:hypothetical protein